LTISVGRVDAVVDRVQVAVELHVQAAGAAALHSDLIQRRAAPMPRVPDSVRHRVAGAEAHQFFT
jgi:hypothetical protein